MHMAYIYLNALTRRQPSVKGRSTVRQMHVAMYVCMYVHCTHAVYTNPNKLIHIDRDMYSVCIYTFV